MRPRRQPHQEAEHEQHAAAEHDQRRGCQARWSDDSGEVVEACAHEAPAADVVAPQPVQQQADAGGDARRGSAAGRRGSPGRGTTTGRSEYGQRSVRRAVRRPWRPGPYAARESGSLISPSGPAEAAAEPRTGARRGDARAALSACPRRSWTARRPRRRSATELTERVAALAAAGHRPGLGTLLVGRRPGQPLVRQRQAPRLRRGRHRQHPARAARHGDAGRRRSRWSTELNADPACTGYIVQLPLPAADRRVRRPRGDGPGQGRRRAAPGQPRPAGARTSPARCRARRWASSSCSAASTCRSPAPRSSSIGRGITVGRPLGLLLTRRSENATVTLCHTGTRDLAAHVRTADIVVAAAGVPGLITAGDGQAGGRRARRRRQPGGREDRRGRRPGRRRRGRSRRTQSRAGSGPMTRAMLLQNVVLAAERAAALESLRH